MFASIRTTGFIRTLFFTLVLCAVGLLSGQSPVVVRAQQKTDNAGTPPQGKQRARRVQTPTSDDASLSDDDVVRVETDLTNVLFTAMDRQKRFVTTLKKEDVRVLENGVPQEVSVFQRETDLPLSIALLVDTSSSEELTLPDEKAAARAFIDSIIRPDKDQAAVISFTGDSTVEQDLTNDRASLRAAIERIKIVLPPKKEELEVAGLDADDDPRGWSSIWDAVWATSDQLISHTPERTRRAIIILTDGDDTHSKVKRQEAIDAAVKANTVIYAIGIGDSKNYSIEYKKLINLAEQTGGRAFFPEDEEDLRVSFEQIQQELRSQYLLAYTPTNKARDGSYRRIALEVVNPELRKEKLRLLYRQGYYAGRARPSAAAAQSRP